VAPGDLECRLTCGFAGWIRVGQEGVQANVNVADATLFPRSLGNPPILTIIAMARRIAAICAAQVAPAHLARSRR
jgi:hypothetical protein